MVPSLFDRTRTYARLGVRSVLRVAAYRIGLRTGLHPVLRVAADNPQGPFFASLRGQPVKHIEPRQDWCLSGSMFGHHVVELDGVPNWHLNPFAGKTAGKSVPWHRIEDFDPGLGDIKAVWELSRFDWLIAMAQRVATGDESELDRINSWLEDWLAHNPPYMGVNWKCGQEASIRVMHLLMAAMLMGQERAPLGSLCDLIELHLRRIAPTIGYALGQDNNHGTSEATAMFAGGSFLQAAGRSIGAKWSGMGRHWLEERCQSLIANDGSFSQYSLVYHRLFLDTVSFAETWRLRLSLPPFSSSLMGRMAAAAHWLRQFTDTSSGDGPNFGANDGAHIMNLAGADYRDFRPSVQWASALFASARAYEESGSWDRQIAWLDLALPAEVLPKLKSESFLDGGIHVLRIGEAIAYLRFPNFRFRPSQADALHVDLWIAGKNVLRDAGSYSYNCDANDQAYFNGTAAHNTVTFDDRDQMPRIGRFLFSHWTRAEDIDCARDVDGVGRAGAAYRDFHGVRHSRRIELHDNSMICHDKVEGDARKAILRWRLQPGSWKRDDAALSCGRFRLSVECDGVLCCAELREESESRFYLQKSSLPVARYAFTPPTSFTSTFRFS